MQLNYSYLKILKLKIYYHFLVMVFLCPCYVMTTYYYLNHLCFSSFIPFFVNEKSPIFAVGFFEKPPELTKIQNGILLQNNQIVKQGNFVTGMKLFTPNNLIISIMLIWYLPTVNLPLFLPLLKYSRYFSCK